jgi:hypothetical protein
MIQSVYIIYFEARRQKSKMPTLALQEDQEECK